MDSFVQTSSILRRLKILGLLLTLLFLGHSIGTYWANRSLVRGLQKVHDSNQIAELCTQAAESLTAAVDNIRSIPPTANLTDIHSVFRANYEHALGAIDSARSMIELEPDSLTLLNLSR